MRYFTMRALAKDLLASISAARRVAPKIRRPAFSKTSTMPSDSGPSGPTTVRPIFSRRAKSSSRGMSEAAMGTHSAASAIPALPGAQNTFFTFGLWAIFHTRACSLPPPPITSTFMPSSRGFSRLSQHTKIDGLVTSQIDRDFVKSSKFKAHESESRGVLIVRRSDNAMKRNAEVGRFTKLKVH